MITGEIKRFLRDDGMIKVSRSLKEIAYKAKTAKEMMNNRLGREPTIDELAEELGICVEELAVALESGAEVESIYKTIYHGDGNTISLIDKIEETENDNEKLLNRLVLQELISALEPQEKRIITMRYFLDKTQTEIAKEPVSYTHLLFLKFQGQILLLNLPFQLGAESLFGSAFKNRIFQQLLRDGAGAFGEFKSVGQTDDTGS